MSRELLFDVRRNELGHLKHGDLFLSAEDGLERVIRVDLSPFLGVLKPMLLDIVPELLAHLAARQRL